MDNLIALIDVALVDIKHQSLVDADKVRDTLLDLRNEALAVVEREADPNPFVV